MADVVKKEIIHALRSLGIQNSDDVLVHSSMKSFGHVSGGSDTVIDAFLEVIGEEGTLIMPTLSQKNWETVYRDWHLDRPSDVGLLTEVFRKREGTLRSNQATHSVAAFGKRAAAFTEGHTAFGPRVGPFGDYAFSASSPWQKMYDADVKIVFIGISTRYNTMKHLVEYRIYNDMLAQLSESDASEMEKKLQHYGQPPHDQWVWTYLDAMALQKEYEAHGLIAHAFCGDAELLCIRAGSCVDFTLRLIENEPAKWLEPSSFAWFQEANHRLALSSAPMSASC